MRMKATRIKKGLAVAVLALASSAALAGLVQDQPVTVTLNGDGSGNAAGSMTTARFSKNDVEYIGCGCAVSMTARAASFCSHSVKPPMPPTSWASARRRILP